MSFPSRPISRIYDYSVLTQTKQSSVVHVAATLKRHLSAALAPWVGSPVDPDVLTTEAWAYRALLNRVLSAESQSEPVLLAQIGHDHTTLYVHWQGNPVIAREIPWGGRDLTAIISQKYQHASGPGRDGQTRSRVHYPRVSARRSIARSSRVSGYMLAPVSVLLNDLKQIELSCKNLTAP